jgi:hypothetical protein
MLGARRQHRYVQFMLMLALSDLASAHNYHDPVSLRGIDITQGSMQISGDGIGCVSLVQAKFVIPYTGSYSPPPELAATISVQSDQDSVEIDGIEGDNDRAVITITTHGLHGNRVCANSYINFTVQAELD